MQLKDKVDADYSWTIMTCVVLSILGYIDFLCMPILLGSLVDHAGYSEEQVGYLASVDQGGLFVASVITAILVAKFNRRLLVITGILLAVVGNLGSVSADSFNVLLPLRFLAGAGGGIVYAVVVAIMAGSTHTARNFTYLIFWLAAGNAAILYSFPYFASQWGPDGIYIALVILVSLGLTLVHWLPPYYKERIAEQVGEETADNDNVPLILPWLGLAAVFGFYFMIGAYWAYLERIGVHLGFSSEYVGKFLAYCTVLSMLGCGVAYWLSRRYGLSRPLIFSLGLVTIMLVVYGFNINVAFYYLSTAMVFLFWNFIDIYQLGTLAMLDSRGRYCALTPAAQGLAMTLAPACAGYLLGQGYGYASVLFLGAFGVLFSFVAYNLVYYRLKKIRPSLT